MKSHIAVRAVQPVITALQKLEIQTEQLLTEVGIHPRMVENPDGRVPHQTMMRLWEQAFALTGDDYLGIHLAEAAPIESFEVIVYALLSSPTLRDAYHRACRYQRLIHEVTDLTFTESAEEGVLQHMLPGGKSVPRHSAEFLVTSWVRFGRLITGNDWSPRFVCFAHDAPGDVSEHTRVFKSPVMFSSGRTAMHVPNSILDTRNHQADVGLLNVLDQYANVLLKQTPSQTTVSDRVRAWLLEELKGGVPTASNAAKALHMSVRTFHRDLQKEGSTFGELLKLIRQERAVTLLANPRYSISEVAFLLGFSELSSFYRAFKRWTGKTPADFRTEILTHR